MGGDRKLTALGYPPQPGCAALPTGIVLPNCHFFAGKRRALLAARPITDFGRQNHDEMEVIMAKFRDMNDALP
jgi:hypothetical protein